MASSMQSDISQFTKPIWGPDSGDSSASMQPGRMDSNSSQFVKPIWGPGSEDVHDEAPDWNGPQGGGQYGSPAWGAQQSPLEAETSSGWSQDRTEVCPNCLGTRGSWITPQGENGTSTWVQCGRCLGSGKV